MPRTQDDIGIGTTLGETDEQLRKRIKDHREQKKKTYISARRNCYCF